MDADLRRYDGANRYGHMPFNLASENAERVIPNERSDVRNLSERLALLRGKRQ